MSGTPGPELSCPAIGLRNGDLAIPALAFAMGVIVTAEFIVVGLLPALGAGFDVSLDRAGWLVSTFAFSAAVVGPPLTLALARRPPRRVLIVCLALFGLAGVLAALLPDFAVMLAMRGIQGAALTVFISVAGTTAASLAGPAGAGRAVGRINLGTVAGTVFALPAGITFAGVFGWQAVYGGLGLLALAGCLLLRPALPQMPPRQSAPLLEQVSVLRNGRFLLHLLLSTLLFTAMFVSYSYVAAFLEEVTGLSGSNTAGALLWFGLAGIAGNWAASRAVDASPTGLSALVALVLGLSATAFSAFGNDPVALVPILGLWGAAHSAAFVACQVRVMFAAPDAPAFAAALNISVCNAGVALGALLGGRVVSHDEITSIGHASAAVAVATLFVAAFLRRLEPGSRSI